MKAFKKKGQKLLAGSAEVFRRKKLEEMNFRTKKQANIKVCLFGFFKEI